MKIENQILEDNFLARKNKEKHPRIIKKKFNKSIDNSTLISVIRDNEETRKGMPEGTEKGNNPK